MRVKILMSNKNIPCGFLVSGVRARRLCDGIARFPGVVFSQRRFFFWSLESIRYAFRLDGRALTITPDAWDDTLWIRLDKEEEDTDAGLPLKRIADLAAFLEKELNPP